ncbi:hypothetical protein J1605_003081 [Eschrichtius robustus]|uniref:MAP3K deoxyribohydrolase domain-containing protein n=1 Tax=Eschrichtius robustus TaxID=9764 RepID=A0AB34HUG6_ESCRO|nr:hypothetical protein J1605_003081 [Eschrichtius robustus]
MESGGGAPPAGALGAAAESAQCPLPPGDEGAAGPAWPLEPEGAAEGEGAGGEGGGRPRRALRAVYVRGESPQGGAAGGPEEGARRCLLRACEAEGAHLTSVPFGKLDFGETAVLDAFYDAGCGDGRHLGGLERRMGENSAKGPAPSDDLEGAVDFVKKKEGIIVEVGVKAKGPLVLTGGHFNETIRERIKKFPTILPL